MLNKESSGRYKYALIVKLETDQTVVFMYKEEEERAAKDLFEEYRLNWSDVYLCEIIDGPNV